MSRQIRKEYIEVCPPLFPGEQPMERIVLRDFPCPQCKGDKDCPVCKGTGKLRAVVTVTWEPGRDDPTR
jgi:hypothetical protein